MQNIPLLAHTPPLALSVWTARGPDARSFLQGQLTQDTLALQQRHQLTGLCTPKGRLLASMQQWALSDEDLAHLCPTELSAGLIKRLSMYVLRAKVRIGLEDWQVCGLWLGESELPEGTRVQLDEQLWCLRTRDDPAGRPRAWLAGERSQLERWIQSQGSSSETSTSQAWWASEIRAGWPTVWTQTQDTFVPQMLNFDLLDGIGFKKGCYTGQEVVARSQYLGKLNRRMFRMTASEPLSEAHPPGADLFLNGGPDPVGQLVMAADQELLVSVGLEAIQTVLAHEGRLYLGSPEGPPLCLQTLPYAVPTEPQQVNRARL